MPDTVAATHRPGRRLPFQRYVDGILAGDRVVLARAITLIESQLPEDSDIASQLLDAVLPHVGKTRRLGITGVPGVGKSTFIDALGTHLTRERDEPLAVLSVDPSSPISRGSILGDKTRMERLAANPRAFIRPSPAGGHLGGVGRHTREAILLCEAAGYRNIFIETIGVGQSETAVHAMSDFFLLLMLPGAGDELQGIKRGIIEMIDGMAINKADGDNIARAERARAEYSAALHLFPPSTDGWTPRVVCCSSINGTGIAAIWDMVLEHEAKLNATHQLESRRRQGDLEWMKELIASGLGEAFRSHPAVAAMMPKLEQDIRAGWVTPLAASRKLLKLFQPD
ncbi:MAG TPA: methylmalonyl Co-A mutase-associated GTPase MeaB [Chloroflexota bacterium]